MRWFRRVAVAVAMLVAGLLVAPAATGSAGARSVVPEAGTPVGALAPSQVKGAHELADGSWAVPLRSSRPSWVTEERRSKAGKEPQPAPASAIPDVPASGFVGIRPGSWMVAPSGCTMNFVFGSPGSYSIGTAGHCVEKVGQPVLLLTVAPAGDRAGEWVLVEVGYVEKLRDNGIGDDFALVSIKPQYQPWVFTTQAQVLGPCGTFTGDGPVSVESWNPFVRGETAVDAGHSVYHYGHGLAIGTGGTPRTGAATAFERDAYYWAGAVLFGDSGSAARIEDLRAAGNVTHLVVDLKKPGYNAGTRVARMEAIAGKPVADSPYCP